MKVNVAVHGRNNRAEHLAELIFDGCHGGQHLRDLLLREVFGQLLRVTRGRFVCGLHGRNLVLDVLRGWS